MGIEIFVSQLAFNEQLVGKAVHIKGLDENAEKWNGIYLVNFASGRAIVLTDRRGKLFELHMNDFQGEGAIQLTILEEKEETE